MYILCTHTYIYIYTYLQGEITKRLKRKSSEGYLIILHELKKLQRVEVAPSNLYVQQSIFFYKKE